MKKIMVVDNDTLSRESILSYIAQIDSRSSIYEYKCFPDTKVPMRAYEKIDIIIIKLQEIADQNFSALKKLINHFCKAKIVILTQLKNIPRIKQQLCNSSACVIAIDIPKMRIFNSIKYFLNVTIDKQKLTQVTLESLAIESEYGVANRTDISTRRTQYKLTDRQNQVMNFIVKGFSNKLIAYELGISEGTIKLHVSSILRILKVTNRTQAANIFLTSGYTQEPEQFA